MSEEVISTDANDNTGADVVENPSVEVEPLLNDDIETDAVESLLSDDDKADGDNAEQQSVPEEYDDFEVPEGVVFNEPLLDEFKGIAKDAKLSQEKAQELVNLVLKHNEGLVKQQEQVWMEIHKQWNKNIKEDPEFGGANFKETVLRYRRGIDSFGNAELKQMLIQTGYQHHPAMIKLFAGLDKKYGEDQIVEGQAPGKTKTLEQKFYPNTKFK